MGRRERAAGRIGELSSSRVWDAVRRALGRLISQTSVRALSASEMTPKIALRASGAVQPPAVLPGTRERDWKPVSAVRRVDAPQAGTGARHGDLLPSVPLSEGDAVFASPACRMMRVVQNQACCVEAAPLAGPASVVRLPDAFLTLPAAPVRVGSIGLLMTAGAAALRRRKLAGWAVESPKSGALRLPRVADPRVRWGGDAVLSRMALTRRGLDPPPNVPLALAFDAEQRRLAEAAHLPLEDVTLLGVYPGVPILAVSRIVVADEGRLLRLWLKPEVLRGRNAAHLITLLVGRQTSSGKMIQAAL